MNTTSPSPGVRRVRRALAIGLPIALLLLVLSGGCALFRYPAINDISTDLAEPPPFTHATTLAANEGRDMTYPPDFAPVVKKYYPDLRPARWGGTAGEVFDTALAAARGMARWEVTWSDREAGLIEAVATTALLRFRDDIVIRVRPATPDGDGTPTSEIDVRSKSRLGRGDLGANAARIRGFFEALGPAPSASATSP
jgi:uncharacterized protein (DUF1499 family)